MMASIELLVCTTKYMHQRTPEKKIADAVKKLKDDFAGLKEFWDEKCKVNEYHFVFNDKFTGTKPSIEEALSSIKNEHSLNACSPFLNQNLQDILFDLSKDKIYMVIGYIPTSNNADVVKVSAIQEVANYLIPNWEQYGSDGKLVAPDFEDKITFNNLSMRVASLLHTYNYQSGVIEQFFEASGSESREHLQGIFSSLYESAISKYEDYLGSDKNDLIFFNILECACPGETSKATQDACLALMSYYFESCDIFEEPVGE